MKRDEPFNPDVKSEAQPRGLEFRPATSDDRDAIARLMSERNPLQDLAEIYDTTDRELSRMANNLKYRIYVAALNGKVIGFCRFYHSEGLPAAKKKYPAPEAWYGMGIMVDPEFRRRGIARYLSRNRIEVLKAIGVSEFYSFADETNLTSMRMHRALGFEEVVRAPGFLHVALESGAGVLFRLKI